MKTSCFCLVFLVAVALAPAATQTGYVEQPLNVATPNHSLLFAIDWSCDDYPASSAPGRIELRDGGGNLVARLSGSVYRDTGVSVSITGAGSVTDTIFWMFRYATDGSPADGSLQGTWNLTGLSPGTYTLRLFGYSNYAAGRHGTTVWTNSSVLGDWPTPGSNVAPTISWNMAPANAGSGQTYTVTAHGHDDNGDLTQVNVWKNGQPFAFAGGGNGMDGDSGNSTSDAGPQTVTFTAQAMDTTGTTSPTISFTVTIDAPPPTQYSLTASAGPGGSVSAGGVYSAGSTATVVAAPDGTHDFAGWSGDATGAANPLGVTMDGNKSVQANFVLKSFALTTSAMSGGSATPGGSYPYGTTVSIAATPDAAHYFTGWSGDATGTASSIAVWLDRAKFVQALFAPKAAQSISFTPPGDQNVGAALPLTATSSSGLPVNFVVLGGPATFSNGTLTVTGPGPITIQAVQPGDTYTLAAPPVTGTFNAAAPAVLKYHAAARTLLQTGRTAEAANYVLGNP